MKVIDQAIVTLSHLQKSSFSSFYWPDPTLCLDHRFLISGTCRENAVVLVIRIDTNRRTLATLQQHVDAHYFFIFAGVSMNVLFYEMSKIVI